MKPVLGLDWGRARVGVAASDELGLMAHPVETVAEASRPAMIEKVKAIALRLDARGVVVGLPLNMDGSEGESARAARAFADALSMASGLPVWFQDERLTSREAAQKGARKDRIDQAAACLILQGFLDLHRRGGMPA